MDELDILIASASKNLVSFLVIILCPCESLWQLCTVCRLGDLIISLDLN